MRREHLQVLMTLYEHEKISQQQIKMYRTQILRMGNDEEREIFLKKLIYSTRNNKIHRTKHTKRRNKNYE